MTRLFGEIEMTWKRVILFALAVGGYAGLINLIPFLKDTSFQDIDICLEWWVLFAVIIAINCKKPLESAIKTFVFFLISQPVVFLLETPFKGVEVWQYYRYWFIITLLTLPGGLLAYFVRRKNVPAALILSLALILLSGEVVTHSLQAYLNFPHHLLSALASLAFIVLFLMELLDKQALRLFAAAITAIALVVNLAFVLTERSQVSEPLPEIGGQWICALANTSNCSVEVGEGEFTYYYNTYLSTSNEIMLTNENGTSITYVVSRPQGQQTASVTQK